MKSTCSVDCRVWCGKKTATHDYFPVRSPWSTARTIITPNYLQEILTLANMVRCPFPTNCWRLDSLGLNVLGSHWIRIYLDVPHLSKCLSSMFEVQLFKVGICCVTRIIKMWPIFIMGQNQACKFPWKKCHSSFYSVVCRSAWCIGSSHLNIQVMFSETMDGYSKRLWKSWVFIWPTINCHKQYWL